MERREEPLEAAAAREVMEETGIDIAQGRLARWNVVNTFEIYPQWRHRFAPGVIYNTEHVFGLALGERPPVTIAPRHHLASPSLPRPEPPGNSFPSAHP